MRPAGPWPWVGASFPLSPSACTHSRPAAFFFFFVSFPRQVRIQPSSGSEFRRAFPATSWALLAETMTPFAGSAVNREIEERVGKKLQIWGNGRKSSPHSSSFVYARVFHLAMRHCFGTRCHWCACRTYANGPVHTHRCLGARG